MFWADVDVDVGVDELWIVDFRFTYDGI